MSYCTECEAKEQDKVELVADVARLEAEIARLRAALTALGYHALVGGDALISTSVPPLASAKGEP